MVQATIHAIKPKKKKSQETNTQRFKSFSNFDADSVKDSPIFSSQSYRTGDVDDAFSSHSCRFTLQVEDSWSSNGLVYCDVFFWI